MSPIFYLYSPSVVCFQLRMLFSCLLSPIYIFFLFPQLLIPFLNSSGLWWQIIRSGDDRDAKMQGRDRKRSTRKVFSLLLVGVARMRLVVG